MTLKTSSRKIKPPAGLLKFTLKKNIGILFLLIALVMLVCPGYFWVHLSDFKLQAQLSDAELSDMVQIFASIITFFAGAAIILFNFINFSFLYSRRSSDVFHAMPLTRFELLLSRMFAGILFVLIPVIIGYGGLSLIAVLHPELKIRLIGIVICFAYTLATVLVLSPFSMIFIMCAGTVFDLAISFVGGNIAFLVASSIVNIILQNNLIGYGYDYNAQFFLKLSPPVFCGVNLIEYIENPVFSVENAVFFVKCAVIAVIFTVITCILYNRRKSESTEKAYAYRFIYIICGVLVTFCFSFGIGMIFSDKCDNPIFWLFAVLGALLVSIAFGAITDRGFKTVKTSLLIALCSTIIMAGVYIVAASGAFGYSLRTPSKDSIKHAEIHYFGETIEFDDAALPLSLHSAVAKATVNAGHKSDIYNGTTVTLEFEYSLENNKVFNRCFATKPELLKKEMKTLLTCEDRFDTIKKNMSDMRADSAEIYKAVDGSSVSVSKAELEEFIKIYKKELKSAPEELFVSEYNDIVEYSTDDKAYPSAEENASFYYEMNFETSAGRYIGYSFAANKDFTETNEYYALLLAAHPSQSPDGE